MHAAAGPQIRALGALLACASICSDRMLAEMLAGDARLERHVPRARALWHEIRPQSLPLTTIDTDMDAGVPMLRMYSRCTGETLRSTAKLRSSGRPARGCRRGTGRHGDVVDVGDEPQPVRR